MNIRMMKWAGRINAFAAVVGLFSFGSDLYHEMYVWAAIQAAFILANVACAERAKKMVKEYER